jgi:hypothetical protein
VEIIDERPSAYEPYMDAPRFAKQSLGFGGAGEDCSHISGLSVEERGSSGPDGIGWSTPHQEDELLVRGSYQVWSTTV